LTARHRIDVILVSTVKLLPEREQKLHRLCAESGIPLINLHFELQPLKPRRLQESPAK
jgi:hypothetical protein